MTKEDFKLQKAIKLIVERDFLEEQIDSLESEIENMKEQVAKNQNQIGVLNKAINELVIDNEELKVNIKKAENTLNKMKGLRK